MEDFKQRSTTVHRNIKVWYFRNSLKNLSHPWRFAPPEMMKMT